MRRLTCGSALLVIASAAVVAPLRADVGETPAVAVPAAACRGPAGLENFLSLAAGQRIAIRRVNCGVARTVVKGFGRRCLAAYTSQGSCRFRARKYWRCTSKIVGSLTAGAPSSVSCKAGRGRVRFTVEISLPEVEDPSDWRPRAQAATPGAPYNASGRCVNAAAPAKPVAPPPAPDDTFEIRAYGSVSRRFAEKVQARLVSGQVASRLLAGIGARPRRYPQRAPVILTGGETEGITAEICGSPGRDGTVVTVGSGLVETSQTVAHEMVHLYSAGLMAATAYPWFEDPVAEWSTWRAGLDAPSVRAWDVLLQYPDKPVDSMVNEEDRTRYSMWRLVQFLDDRNMIVAGDGSWPLVRGVGRSTPNFTQALDRELRGRGTSLGYETSAFWGEHLKTKPARPPRVVPNGHNGRKLTVRPGRGPVKAEACGLCTSLDDFVLAKEIKRVEFEFESPDDGNFWGLVAPNESRHFKRGDTVSFCVGGADEDDLEWPGHFPITFTNGKLNHSDVLEGEITIYAQTNAEQCTNPTVTRACRVLRAAGAPGVMGPPPPRAGPLGGFRGHDGVSDAGRPNSFCRYTGVRGLSLLDIERWKSSKALRRWIRRKDNTLGWDTVKLGDAAITFEESGSAYVQVAVGRERITVFAPASSALRLARGAVENL